MGVSVPAGVQPERELSDGREEQVPAGDDGVDAEVDSTARQPRDHQVERHRLGTRRVCAAADVATAVLLTGDLRWSAL